jgi:uncharacterized membrane protein
MSANLKSSLFYEKNFRWRAGEITRLEGFSDAVFAFAVTLLVVSLEVPHTFSELALLMKGFVAFAICFALLANVWREHTVFFRRYGLQTPFVMFMNCVLLFLVLFYVYPLKFLFTYLVGEWTGGAFSVSHSSQPALTVAQVPALMSMYGLGFAAVYFVLVALYLYAYRLRAELQLDDIEVLKTKSSIIHHSALMIIGTFSTLLALTLPARLSGLSGFVYFLIPVHFTIAGSILGKRLRALEQSRLSQAVAAAHSA